MADHLFDRHFGLAFDHVGIHGLYSNETPCARESHLGLFDRGCDHGVGFLYSVSMFLCEAWDKIFDLLLDRGTASEAESNSRCFKNWT